MMWVVGGVAFAVSFGSLFVLRRLLRHWGVMDVPNERSSHDSPVLRGAGLAPLLGIAIAYLIFLASQPSSISIGLTWTVLGSSVACGVLGWVEDFAGLRVAVRASLQLSIGILSMGAIVMITGVSPWWIPLGAIAVGGYINAANFMDGVDGISGLHAVVVGVTYAVLGVALQESWLITGGVVIAAAFGGFLPWNLLLGRVFLGDVGSYLLGGGVAVLAVGALANGAPLLAVLGPIAIYLADSGVTLLRRIIGGERWYEAHRSHAYQRLTDYGFSHLGAASVVTIASAITALVGLLAVGAPAHVIVLLTIAALIVIILYFGLVALLKRRHGALARSEVKGFAG
jgi:UDP-N-acetylmuramyl pentapeptide phosphotransferase/UDP-N-acetylglucosamine-1-phosphate transferase